MTCGLESEVDLDYLLFTLVIRNFLLILLLPDFDGWPALCNRELHGCPSLFHSNFVSSKFSEDQSSTCSIVEEGELLAPKKFQYYLGASSLLRKIS
jgi:hypothetical protein